MTNEEEKINAGILFYPEEPELRALKLKSHNLSQEYSLTREDEVERRNQILQELVGEIGENVIIQGPVFFHYGCHTHIGKQCFFNYNLTIQDDARVTVGDGCAFGPNVTIVTPLHPMISTERHAIRRADGSIRGMCYAKPVTIGKNCWIGANVVVCPGVSIGEGCVIGAGSVVTRDIPSGTFAAGVPARVIRKITEQDSMRRRPEILADNELI